MNEYPTSRAMATWADIFRKEGDTETADAIQLRLERAARANLTEEDAYLLRLVLDRAKRFEGKGRYAEAADHYSEALRVVEATFGACHPDTFEYLSVVARCQFNARQYGAAMQAYGRLLKLVEDRFGLEHALINIARDYMRTCCKGMRDTAGALRLYRCMNGLLRQAQGLRLMEAEARADRMRDIARQLVVRGRRNAAVRLHAAAIELRLQDVDPDSEIAYQAIHPHDDGHHSHVHDVMPTGSHSHVHFHEPVTHAHPHAPDVHHQHRH